MRNPRLRVDSSGFDQANDVPKRVRSRIAARTDRELTPVEIRIAEGDVALNQTDEDDATPVRGEVKRAGHRFSIAGRVEHNCGQLSATDRADCFSSFSSICGD